MSSNLVDIRRGIEEARRAVAESRRFREGFALALKHGVAPAPVEVYTEAERAQIVAAGKDPDVLARTRGAKTLTEFKVLRDGGGQGVELKTVGVDGEVIKDTTPAWTRHLQREREAGRLSRIQEAILDGRLSPERIQAAKRVVGGQRRLHAEFNGGGAR